MPYLLVVALFVVSCLVSEHADEKALHRGRAKNTKELHKDRKKLTEEIERERKEAKKTFGRRCGSVLKRPKWMEGNGTDNGFFLYETKSLVCKNRQIGSDRCQSCPLSECPTTSPVRGVPTSNFCLKFLNPTKSSIVS